MRRSCVDRQSVDGASPAANKEMIADVLIAQTAANRGVKQEIVSEALERAKRLERGFQPPSHSYFYITRITLLVK